ncbi:MAG: DNA repair protein RadA [Dehalococcoidia bacterium]|nr:DNA repair protein RadA [Dehalococcoidia bacterium]
MPKAKIVFMCQECGRESARWLGRCPACHAWNSLAELSVPTLPAARSGGAPSAPQELSAIDSVAEPRWILPLGELGRALGGGLVPGSVILIGGEPGIGKSTLLLQASAALAKERGCVVYVSGEETLSQIKLRARRLDINGEQLFLLAENNLDHITAQLDSLKPVTVVVDSIQSVYAPDIESSPGSISQVRDCTLRLVTWAKANQVPVFITGHVTKEGAIAGPRLLEHMVDTVLYFEGESLSSYRLLRAVKNRFGSVSEMGIFEMRGIGLVEVGNPSQIFLSERENEAIGSAVTATLEGSRPLLVVIQALTNPSVFGQVRRTASGVDFNRLLLISAVLSRRLSLRLGNQDIITNVTGGIKIDEPAADLAIALAIASSLRDVPVDPETVAVGEVGLSGEIRAVPQLERRLGEAARLGFRRAIVPYTSARHIQMKDIELIPVSTLRKAIEYGLGKKHQSAEVAQPPPEEMAEA